MDYEKKYKEALTRAESFYRNGKGSTKSMVYTIFPELKESEDESIRKAILEHIQLCTESIPNRDKFIAWLEKQGEKPANRVEPKFKIGDWVMLDRPVLITKVEDMSYNTHQYWTSDGTWFGDATNAKLWTIQDAKDGDVLYLQKDEKEHIIIYKGVIKERFRAFVSAYCAYNGIVEDFCFADVSRYVDIAYGGIMPATKEQRELLFQKMKEAGYMWDAEKKELKKIEQKPAWSEADESWFKELELMALSFSNDDSYRKKFFDWFKSLKDRVQPQPKHWKPTEEQLTCLEDVLCIYHNPKHLTSLLNELKAL